MIQLWCPEGLGLVSNPFLLPMRQDKTGCILIFSSCAISGRTWREGTAGRNWIKRAPCKKTHSSLIINLHPPAWVLFVQGSHFLPAIGFRTLVFWILSWLLSMTVTCLEKCHHVVGGVLKSFRWSPLDPSGTNRFHPFMLVKPGFHMIINHRRFCDLWSYGNTHLRSFAIHCRPRRSHKIEPSSIPCDRLRYISNRVV